MLKARLDAVRAVTEDFAPAEVAIDDAFQRVVTLLNTMCAARNSANLSMYVARREFDQISSALLHLGEARSHILNAHEAFVDTRSEVLPTVAFGDNGSCPPGNASLASISTAKRAAG